MAMEASLQGGLWVAGDLSARRATVYGAGNSTAHTTEMHV
jgi:hypothetical protein